MKRDGRQKGIIAAIASALFLGAAPVFGKLAMEFGFSPLAVIAIRTSIATLLMLVLMLSHMRGYFYIYPFGLAGCLLAGVINGLGSILYYVALSRLDAGIGHMLYSFYPLFLALWLLLDHQPITRLTAIRLALTIPAIFLLILPGKTAVDLVSALMMLGSAAMYSLHMLINQRILYEAPAPTVTLYTLLAMAVTVDIAFIAFGRVFPTITITWWPVLAMALITFFSRLALFMGIKHLGGLQTALLGLAELFITVILAQTWLGEHLEPAQWAGAGLLAMILILIGRDKTALHKRGTTGWFAWLNPKKMPRTEFPGPHS